MNKLKEPKTDFAKFLRATRATKFWSQTEMAGKLGILQCNYSLIESGEIVPNSAAFWLRLGKVCKWTRTETEAQLKKALNKGK